MSSGFRASVPRPTTQVPCELIKGPKSKIVMLDEWKVNKPITQRAVGETNIKFLSLKSRALTQRAAGRPYGRTAGSRREKHLFGFQKKLIIRNSSFFVF